MHTPESIAELSNEEAQALLNDLARQFYGTERYKTRIAADIGMTGDGVANWFRAGNRPPPLVILWLEVSLRVAAADDIVAKFRAITESVQNYPA